MVVSVFPLAVFILIDSACWHAYGLYFALCTNEYVH